MIATISWRGDNNDNNRQQRFDLMENGLYPIIIICQFNGAAHEFTDKQRVPIILNPTDRMESFVELFF